MGKYADQIDLTRICREHATCTSLWSYEEEQRKEKYILLDQSAPETASRQKTLPKRSEGLMSSYAQTYHLSTERNSAKR